MEIWRARLKDNDFSSGLLIKDKSPDPKVMLNFAYLYTTFFTM